MTNHVSTDGTAKTSVSGDRWQARSPIPFAFRMLVCWLATVMSSVQLADACPFCNAFPRTLSDDLADSAAAVLVNCEALIEEEEGFYTYRLRVTHVVKGSKQLRDTAIELPTLQPDLKGKRLLLLGFGKPDIQWGTPKEISSDGLSYLLGLDELPESGPVRLEYFLRFLQHADTIIAEDAYNEFAEASLEEMAGIKKKLDRLWVKEQLSDPNIPLHHRRLCWTFLSLCGKAEDAHLFNDAMKQRQNDPTFRPGMDAAISCFLTLGGERALTQIEEEYLSNKDAEYVDVFAAISAVRVHGTELNTFPRERLSASLRCVLSRPELADLVVPDLARWKDWSVIDRMVELFEMSTEEHTLLKSATVLYLKNCPLPESKKAIERLKKIDSEAVSMAESSIMWHTGRASIPVPPPESSTIR
ncbi:MAG: hypothetical protein AAGG48_25580 [Planctomycetota bacterium]